MFLSKFLTTAFALVVCAGFAAAADEKAASAKGAISAVDAAASTVTIQPVTKDGKQADAVTLTVNAETKITVEKKAATIADLKVGEHARASYSADKVALKIAVGPAGGHKDHKDHKDGDKPATSAPDAPAPTEAPKAE